jgi:hypothetical protein
MVKSLEELDEYPWSGHKDCNFPHHLAIPRFSPGFNVKKKRVILFYNMMFTMPLCYNKADIPEEFELTTDRRLMQEAVAVIFHIPSLFSSFDKLSRFIPAMYSIPLGLQRLRKKRGQIWIAWFMESEVNIPHFRAPFFLNYFELIMSYHLDADIVTPYFYYGLKDLLRSPVREKADGKNVCAFISSPFHKSGRLNYLKTLMNYLDIHSCGKVLRNKILEKDAGRETKMDTIADYKFTIAFENSIARDYVTEKFYDPLIAGSVPIYLGAPNIADFAPGDTCFINVSDWADPESLARYLLSVSKDKDLYQSYFDWRSKPFKSHFMTLLEQQKEHAFVRLCRKIQEIN